MPYNSQPLNEMVRQLEKDIALALDLNELPLICSERAIAFAVGAAKRDIHDHIDYLAKQIVPSSDSDEQTIVDAASYEGVPRKLARKSTGGATISAAADSVLLIDTLLQHDNGLQFIVISSSAVIEGEISFEFVAIVTGSAGNLINEPQTISLVSPIAGIESTANIITLSGGADLEPISELLSRLYFRKQNPAMGGALHDYQAWALEVPEVTRAWPVDAYRGGSTVGLTFTCDSLVNIVPSDAKIQEVDGYIFKHQDPATGDDVGRPAGIEVILFKLTLKTIQLSIKLVPDTQQTRDAVIASLSGLERAFVEPATTIKLSQVRTAIGNSQGVFDYECDLSADITSSSEQLITFGMPTWTV